ncbi:glycolate oxidase subunit GlcF [Sphingobium lignivorans]|uniref:Glycolate oxidase iron-sulfur subunit n=1 Tax=Sphingobium lignivorans TaxID=2735886 RepID=A0ABR6NJR9_9SPHN|nr:glycolate oxidase subunit GlcF [Sphingobium lignivorans]MBB5987520.1 glycolate oxidase iron-sulfur subunit [Sphingobium lignivorans]
MRTDFTPEQLVEPGMRASEQAIRNCVHCGFCTATCPTYVLKGDELESPRGRIYLIKRMLEDDATPGPETVAHIDSCLSCLSCMTTCPSSVNYMQLIDHARAHVAARYRRPWHERLARCMITATLPHPGRMRIALGLGRLVSPLAGAIARIGALKPVAAMLGMARQAQPPGGAPADIVPVPAVPRMKVALMRGCAESVLRPDIRAAAVRVLHRAGCAVVDVEGEGCCGALVHHMGGTDDALAAARRNVDGWTASIVRDGIEAIAVTTSGCGSMVKHYGDLLRDDPVYAEKAQRISAMALDISELLVRLAPPLAAPAPLTIAYHPPCSLQHGQSIRAEPVQLLERAGFRVVMPREAHLCCGSAGTYNILQPDTARALGARKVGHLAALGADAVVTGNLGCMMQIGQSLQTPVLHLAELLDWANGGPLPRALAEAGRPD